MPIQKDHRANTAYGSQPVSVNDNSLGLLTATGLGAGFAATGFIKTNKGRMWDTYIGAIRSIETATPGAVFRTFRTSEFLSPLETWSQINISPEVMQSRGAYGSYLRKVAGDLPSGFTAKKADSVFGAVIDANNKTVGYALNVASGTQRGEGIADYFARVSGTTIPDSLSMGEGALFAEWEETGRKIGMSFKDWKDLPENRIRQPYVPLVTRLRDEVNIFGKKISLKESTAHRLAKGELTVNYLRAKAGTTVGRLNNLLQKPFEIPVVGKALEKIPFIRSMSIQQGTASQMWGRYTMKGIAAMGVWKGLEYYDYLRANNQTSAAAVGTIGGAALGGLLFKKPIQGLNVKSAAIGAATGLYSALSPRFEKGLFHGTASFFTDAALMNAKVSESISLTQQLQEQGKITPGLITPGAAIASAGVGALSVGLYGYGSMMKEAVATKIAKKLPFDEIIGQLRVERQKEFADKWSKGFGRKLSKIPFVGKGLSKTKSPAFIGAVGGLAAWTAVSSTAALMSGNLLAAIPGLNLLGSDETEEQLQKWYSGEEEVAVRKGRFWEFGRSSSYAGGKVDYYRQHFMARLESRAYQKGLWGDEEKKWAHDPVLHPLKAIFGSDEWKYAYEIEHQYDRPAPLTGTYGEDVPFFGPILAATVGKILKPRKLVRPEEWINNNEGVRHHASRDEFEPVYELGGLQAGAPVMPDEATQLFNELMYKRREAVGLAGFAEGVLQKNLTGREEVFQNKQVLAAMGEELSSESWLWDHLNLGGGFFTTEAIRRFIPHKRSYLQEYNPLTPSLPSWMPEDYFMDYEHGNPYQKIKEAEIRLPGPGLASLYPELEGVDPEDYSLAWRTKVLGDVAMWSDEYKATIKQALSRKSEMSDYDQAIVEATRAQVKSKKTKRKFDEYQFRSEELDTMNLTVSEVLSPREVKTEELGDMIVRLRGVGAVTNSMSETMDAARARLEGKNIQFSVSALRGNRYANSAAGPAMDAVAMMGDTDYGQSMYEGGFTEQAELSEEFSQLRYDTGEQISGQIGEFYSRALSTPVEYLTPVSPTSKFYRQRSAIEEFAATEAIGTGNAFWDRPFENFFAPAMEMAEYKLGDRSIPEPVQRKRAVQEYFNALEYVKKSKVFRDISNGAYEEWELEHAEEYIEEYKPSIWDINPYTSPSRVMQALPRTHRDFFKSFSEAKTLEDRQQIANLVSDDERRIYLARWARQEETALEAKKEAGLTTKDEDQELSDLVVLRKTGGYGVTQDLEEQWMAETNGDIPYDKWITRKKTQEYFRGRTMPGPDWIGWHPAVDLKDIQVQYVESEGMDHHDFDLWGDRVRSLARKPYLHGADDQLEGIDGLSAALEEESQMLINAKTIGSFMKSDSSDIMLSRINANINSEFSINIQDKRKGLVDKTYENMGMKSLRDY